MPWLRIGDDASTHPKMFRLLEACGYDHSLKNEAFGVLVTAATVSAGHLEDYIVAPGLVATFAPGREKTIIDALVAAELAEWITVDERQVIRILEDEDFIHMRSREEVEIDRGRKADMRDMSLIIPVRLRDGDQCRWCGRTVNWFDRKGTRGGTIDSLTGHKNSSVDTLVVACRGCNTRRGNGEELELRAEPQSPYYDERTIAWINDNQWAKDNGVHLTPKQTTLDLGTVQAAHEADDQAAADAAPVRGPAAPDLQAAPSQAAAPTTSGPAAPGAGAPEPSTPQPAGPRDELDDAPDWVTAPLNQIMGRTDSTVQAAHEADDQAAADAAPARGPAAPDGNAPRGGPPECNEQIKPGPDLGHVGDGTGFAGTGRDGKVSVRAGEKSALGLGRSRKRGRRSGRKR